MHEIVLTIRGLQHNKVTQQKGKKMKGRITSTIIAVGMFCSISGFAVISVSVMKMKELKPVDNYFTGKTESLESVNLAFQIKGKVEKIKQFGDFVFSANIDSEGKTVREGTIVASLNDSLMTYALKKAELKVKIAKFNLQTAKEEFERNSKMVEKNAISRKAYNTSRTDLLKAELDLEVAKNEYSEAKYNLAACNLVAPFSGQITKIYVGKNAGVGDGDSIIQLTRMNPMIVKVPFPYEIVNLIDKGAKVEVYPVGSSKPVIGWVEAGSNEPRMLDVYVPNELIPRNKLTSEQQMMPKIFQVFPVIKYFENNPFENFMTENKTLKANHNELAVPVIAIHNDTEGTFVWKAVDQTMKNGIARQFKVEKVYVKEGNLKKFFNLGLRAGLEIISLADSASLNQSDVIILYSQGNLINDGYAVRESVQWEFTPDTEVKINIPAIGPKAIYVPRDAVIHEAEGSNYVYIVENNKAKLIQVDLIGAGWGCYAISGDGIKAGIDLIIPSDVNQIDQLYSGAEVKIINTTEGLERIEYPRAHQLQMSIEKVNNSFFPTK